MVAAKKITLPADASLTLVRGTKMQALVQHAYGSADVLRFEEVEVPSIGDDDVLVRVHAAAVCKGDVVLMTGKPYLARAAFGVRRPKYKVTGQNIAGVIEAVGTNVTSLKPGDAVFGLVKGGFAEYVSARADTLAHKPTRLSFEEAASIPDSGTTALQGLRDAGQLKKGQSVLINGASGGVGTFAVQIAKAMGARVTAVCSTTHVDGLRAIGADDVIDYTREDFTQRGPFDVMLDLVGNRPVSACKALLTDGGTYVSSGGSPGGPWFGFLARLLQVIAAGMTGKKRMVPFLVQPTRDDLIALSALVDAGKLAPVIERRFPFAAAAAAVRHVAEGHAHGKTVITIRS